jgi:hypothetical protein
MPGEVGQHGFFAQVEGGLIRLESAGRWSDRPWVVARAQSCAIALFEAIELLPLGGCDGWVTNGAVIVDLLHG